MADKLPIYKCIISPDLESELEVEYVALVDRPAISRTFLKFNEKLKFAVDEDRQIVSGPAMVADMLLYRKDDTPGGLGEYYTQFDKPTIFAIVEKFFKKGLVKNFNLMHDPEQKTGDGVTIFESFISDKERGVLPLKGFEDCPDGSWFISCKIDDPAVWEKVKSGEVKGFSVEGIFAQLLVSKVEEEEDSKLESAIEKMLSILSKKKKA